MLFDHTKGALKVRDTQLQFSLLRSQSIFVDSLRIDIAVLKSSRDVYDTYQFFGATIGDIKETRDNIRATEDRINVKTDDSTKILAITKDRFAGLKLKIGNDENF